MPPQPSSESAVILFVDDDDDVQTTARLLLTRRGYRMLSARSPAEALSHLAVEPVGVVLLDLNFAPLSTSGEEGLGLLAQILRHDPSAAAVVVTGHSGINVAVAAMRAGASDFVMKPWSNHRLVAAIEDALERRRRNLERQGPAAPAAAAAEEDQALILGDSPAMQRVRDLVARAAATPAAVLVHGEAGTGKSLIARAIHRQAVRAQAPFVVLDLTAASAAPDAEAQFFEQAMATAFEAAKGGDLVLDEVGGLSAASQGRLSAYLAARRTSAAEAMVRTIATTTHLRRSLEEPGGLRPDLLYPLSTLEIFAPPLRDRREDIPILAEHFLRLYATRYGRPFRPLSKGAAQVLAASAWPGNVRALQQAVERGVILSDGAEVDLQVAGAPAALGGPETPAPVPTLAHSEKALVEAALKRHSFNVSRAAQDLGLTRAALYRRMAKHGL